jgi:hypothetical protein
VIWKPDQIFKKSVREGDVSREASPSRFCGQGTVLTASQGCPISPNALCGETWETRTLNWDVEEFRLISNGSQPWGFPSPSWDLLENRTRSSKNRPLAFVGTTLSRPQAEGCPISPNALCWEMWEMRTPDLGPRGSRLISRAVNPEGSRQTTIPPRCTDIMKKAAQRPQLWQSSHGLRPSGKT